MDNSLHDRISRHDMVIDGPLTHPFESIHMGNGDIGASVNIYPHEVKIMLAKSDVWDARSNADPQKLALKHDDLIKLMADKDRDLFNIWEVGEENADYIVDCYREKNRKMPEPKRAGCIRIFHPGLSNTKLNTRLRLVDGVLETVFTFAKGSLTVRAFVERGNNRVWVQAEPSGDAPWVVFCVEKEPDDYDITMPLPVLVDEGHRSTSITQSVPAGYGFDKFNWTVATKFPDEGQWLEYKAWRVRQYCPPGVRVDLCVSIATDRDEPVVDSEDSQSETNLPDISIDISDGVPANTSEGLLKNILDGAPGSASKENIPKDISENTRKRALELVNNGLTFNEALVSHRDLWAKFWQTSNITLADEALESVWYRNHFGYGAALGANPLGSAGNVLIQDSIPWNGDCHLNHNFQKWYCTAFATNHPEWIELYARFIEEKLPIFKYHAELVFGLEGAFCDISYFPFMVKQHSNIINHVGRALAVTGWVGVPLWQHWEYFRDIYWLRDRAYPFLKAAAQFYWNYLQKYSDADSLEYEIFPSIRLEEPHWTKDFIGCRNTISDLCMFKRAFSMAVEAATILNTDKDWRDKWSYASTKIPEIGHGIDENGNGWLALDKHWHEVEPVRRADESRYSRWGGGGWIVYPGEYVAGDGDDPLTQTLRTMLKKTDLMNPFISEVTGKNMYPGVPVIHPISSLVPSIRLGITEHFATIKEVLLAHRLTYGQACSYMLSTGNIPKEVNSSAGFMWYDWRSVENKYAGVLAINEMLLQSHGGLIRIFPFIPQDMDAGFENFRAVGGFIVSAQKKQGRISVKIYSECGQMLRLKFPNKDEISQATKPGEHIEMEDRYEQ